MPENSLVAICTQCRHKFRVGPKHFGKAGKCPQCDAALTFPGTPVEKASAPKIKVSCEACGAVLTLPAKAQGKKIRCPKCKEVTRVDPKQAKKIKAKKKKLLQSEEDATGDAPLLVDDADRKTFNAFEVMQKSKQDSYWVACWRACLYPFDALGALVFFVVGMPVTIALTEVMAKWALSQFGSAFARPEAQSYAAAGIVAISMAIVAAAFSFFCSFLFAVVRTSASGRLAIPVVQGMYHRSNLAAVLAWLALFFGPGLYLAFSATGQGADGSAGAAEAIVAAAAEGQGMLTWTPAAIGVTLVLGLVAPMAFLCSATESAVAGINVPLVLKSVAALIDKYLYMLLALGVAVLVFVGLGAFFGDMATEALGAESPNYAKGLPLRIVSGLCYMFPLVIGARQLGLMAKHWDYKLPFEVDLDSEHKASIVPQLIAFAGAALLFVPLHSEAKSWSQEGGISIVCRDHLRSIYYDHLRLGDRVTYVQNYEELAKKIGNKTVCPAFPERSEPFYVVESGMGAQLLKPAQRLLWIYESEATGPNKDWIWVLLLNGELRKLYKPGLENLLEKQKRILESSDRNDRERLYNAYKTEMVKFTRAY